MSGCFCVGPQNGEPMCPCKMEQMKKWVNILEKSDATQYIFTADNDGKFDAIKAALNEINSRKNK